MMRFSGVALCTWLCLSVSASSAAEPLAAKYLYDGKLADGAKVLEKHLGANPKDQEAQLGLGVIQFFHSFERLGTNLYKYGLRTSSNFPLMPRPVRDFFPENPRPEKLDYPTLRKMVQTFLDDLLKAEATLAKVNDEKIKFPLLVGKIKIDLFGVGKPVSAAVMFGRLDAPDEVTRQAEKFVIHFDRGDVSWLRGYIHFMAANLEFLQALDAQELFETTFHRLFQDIKTPHQFLTEEDRDLTNFGRDFQRTFPPVIDGVSLVYHAINLPFKEPARLKKVITHLQQMIVQGKEMWKYILAETDDDHEWIPNPKQKGVMNVPVSKDMIDNWVKTLEETDLILQGKKLLPFWRGKKGALGVNLNKVLTSPPNRFDFIRWVQGTAATPYLEKGTITNLSDPATIGRLDRVFGGSRFFGFAFWFN